MKKIKIPSHRDLLVREHLKEKLDDPYFKELYELEMQKLELSNKIVVYRIKHNLSQKQLAEKVGVTQQHISKVEQGEFSSLITLEKILLAIGYSVSLQAKPLTKVRRKKLSQTLDV